MKVRVIIKDSSGKELHRHDGEVSEQGELGNLAKEAMHQARLMGIDLLEATLSFDVAKEG